MYSKLAIIAALTGSAAAFTPSSFGVRSSTAVFQHIGAGGMADTRDPTAFEHEDPRKSIKAAPSFEEYLKSRGGGAAAAPAASSPASSLFGSAPGAPATPAAPAAPAAPA